MNKPTPAQQFILDRMKQGYVLSSHLDTKYRPFDMPAESGGDLYHPDHDARYCKRILLSTVKAMLAKGFIAEQSRYICSSGTWGEHETETWCINYQLSSDENNTPNPPHWPAGAKVMRKAGNLDIGVTLDETWQNWDGNGYFNKVRWEGSRCTTTVRADRLKEAGERHE